jgi:iron complex transport system ATP-binding protein
MPVLTAEKVSFSYERTTPILKDVNLSIEKGEFFGLVGPNGSGKTTLLRLLDRIHEPVSGRILLNGRSLNEYRRNELARKIAFVSQEAGVQYPFSALEIVLMGRAPHMTGKVFENSHDRDIALHAMKLTDVAHRADHLITTLSDGERQRVFIARALAQQPEILLLDEPNAHLDIAHQLDIFRILKHLNKHEGLTVVSVSHDLNLAAHFSSSIAVMVCGTVTAAGTPTEVLTEQTILEVFQTPVLVDTHPTTSTPRITLHP